MQAATYLLACVAAPHRTSHPSQQKDAVHSCAPARGRWPTQAQDRCAAPHGWLRTAPVLRPLRRPPRHSSPTRHVPLQQQQGRRKGGHPVVSNRPLHRSMQQRCHHASASAPSPSIFLSPATLLYASNYVWKIFLIKLYTWFLMKYLSLSLLLLKSYKFPIQPHINMRL